MEPNSPFSQPLIRAEMSSRAERARVAGGFFSPRTRVMLLRSGLTRRLAASRVGRLRFRSTAAIEEREPVTIYSDEHEMLRTMCRDFADSQLVPIAAEVCSCMVIKPAPHACTRAPKIALSAHAHAQLRRARRQPLLPQTYLSQTRLRATSPGVSSLTGSTAFRRSKSREWVSSG